MVSKSLWVQSRCLRNENRSIFIRCDNFPLIIPPMPDLALIVLPIVAAGYSLVYLLFGGGIGGAVAIFFVAKLLGK